MFKRLTKVTQIYPTRDISYTYKAAVLLHGCGVQDGTETTEAVACMVGLSRAGA
jgi:hypothetical protein